MPGANFWALLFSITLFMLGIDSAFAMVEGTVIVIEDSERFGKKLSKQIIAIILCVVGAAASTIFCFNWSFAFFDSIDHYLNVYLIMLCAILQSIAAAWYHCQDDAMKTCKISAVILLVGYFGLLAVLPWLQYFVFPNSSWVGLPIYWIWFIVVCLCSFLSASVGTGKIGFMVWYEEIFFSGCRPICAHMLARNETKWHWFADRLFEFWWCFSIKYVFPWAMYTLLVMTTAADIKKPYGGLHIFWQIAGIIVPVVGFIMFLIPLIGNKSAPSGEFKRTFAISECANIKDLKPSTSSGNQVAPTNVDAVKEVELQDN